MSWLLRAKHWQIFILIFVIPFVIEISGFIAVAITRQPEILFGCLFFVMAFTLGTQFSWFYAVGSALGEKIGPNSGMNLRRFRNFVFIPAVYLLIFMVLMIGFFLLIMDHGRPSPFLGLILLVIFPLHFFSIFCIFYSIWFVAKSLKMAERWNHVELSDYIGDFFLVWFLVIGIWFIQPRINSLFDPTLPPSPPKNPNPYPNYPPPNYNPYFNNPYPPNYNPGNPNQYPPNYPPPPPPTDYTRYQPPTDRQ